VIVLIQVKNIGKWVLPSRLQDILRHCLYGTPLNGKFRPSKLATKYLKNLSGLEIGGSAHNLFGLKTKNVDFQEGADTAFKNEENEENEKCGETLMTRLETVLVW
jgi:hypothetical protein